MTLAGLIEAARRAVKMHLQNMREQNKFDDVFTTSETRVLELDTLSSPRQKYYQHVPVDLQRHISLLMYATRQNM